MCIDKDHVSVNDLWLHGISVDNSFDHEAIKRQVISAWLSRLLYSCKLLICYHLSPSGYSRRILEPGLYVNMTVKVEVLRIQIALLPLVFQTFCFGKCSITCNGNSRSIRSKKSLFHGFCQWLISLSVYLFVSGFLCLFDLYWCIWRFCIKQYLKKFNLAPVFSEVRVLFQRLCVSFETKVFWSVLPKWITSVYVDNMTRSWQSIYFKKDDCIGVVMWLNVILAKLRAKRFWSAASPVAGMRSGRGFPGVTWFYSSAVKVTSFSRALCLFRLSSAI